MFGGNCGQIIVQSCEVKHFVHAAQPFSNQKTLREILVPSTVRLITETYQKAPRGTKYYLFNQEYLCKRWYTIPNIYVHGPISYHVTKFQASSINIFLFILSKLSVKHRCATLHSSAAHIGKTRRTVFIYIREVDDLPDLYTHEN